MSMRMARFSALVRHVPGKNLVIADCLSRSPLPLEQQMKLSQSIGCTKVPVLSKNLQPVNHNDIVIRLADTKAKQDYKKYFNQRHGVRDLPTLQPDDAVRVKTSKQKKLTDYGRVMCPADSSGRSYIITSPCGVIRRNQQHLQKVPELPRDTSAEPDVDLPEDEDTTEQEDGDTSRQEDGDTPEQAASEPISTCPYPSNNQSVKIWACDQMSDQIH
ncbi:hypothetical protein ACOMHN_043363 [Nucella lapillus]